MSEIHTSHLRIPTGTVDEVLELYRLERSHHGNDLDLLTQSMMLVQAGHYREAMQFALRVMPDSPVTEGVPDSVTREQAQTAFLTANERARPLYEQAAHEIEGLVEGSQTISTYEAAIEMLRSDPNW